MTTDYSLCSKYSQLLLCKAVLNMIFKKDHGETSQTIPSYQLMMSMIQRIFIFCKKTH